VQDSPALVQAVTSGSAEAGVALGDVTMRAIDQKAPVIMVGGYLVKTPMRMVGTKEVKSGKDFTGSRMTAGAVKGGTTDLMLYQLKGLGVDHGTIQRVSIPNSRDRIVALESGQVKGAMLVAPFDVLAIQKGFPVIDVFKEPYVQTPLIINTNWAAKNRGAAEKLVKASKSAAAWVNDPKNRKEAVDILAKFTTSTPEVAEASYQFLVVEQKATMPDFSIPAAAITNITKMAREINPDEQKDTGAVDVRKYYDESFISAK
jgi:ABC-type nitrate/sulfonate/bicarbonate transport system substrate-binding protein